MRNTEWKQTLLVYLQENSMSFKTSAFSLPSPYLGPYIRLSEDGGEKIGLQCLIWHFESLFSTGYSLLFEFRLHPQCESQRENIPLKVCSNMVLIPRQKALNSNPPLLKAFEPRHIHKHTLKHTPRTTCEQHMGGKYFLCSTLVQFIPILIRSVLSA